MPELTRVSGRLAPRSGLLAVFSTVLLGASVIVPDVLIGLVLLATGVSFGVAVLAVRVLSAHQNRSHQQLCSTTALFIAHDASPGFLADPDGEVFYCNASAKDRFGTTPGQSLAGCIADFFANPTEIVFRLQNRASAFGAATEDSVTKRGHIRLSVHQIGQSGYLWRVEDIADRGPARSTDALTVPMLTASKSGTVLFMNEAMREMLGGRPKTLDRIFPGLPLRSGQLNEISSAEGKCHAVVAEYDSAAGRREIYILRGTATQSAVVDWQFFDELPVPMLKIAPDGKIRMANRLARALLDDPVAPETVLSDLVEGLGRSVADWLQDAAAGRGLNHPEVLRATRPPSEVYLQVTLGRVIEDDQPMLVAVLVDATELKTLEAQFVQSQKMQAIGQLAGGVAHDFNNLLTAISGHCDLLMLRHDENDPEYGDLVQISQNSNRAASLVGQLLAFSRKQNLQPQVLDLRDTLADLTHLLNRLVGETVSLSLTHDPALLPIRADKRQLEQVLMNLVVNARDAMPAGGDIRIETETRRLVVPLARDRVVVPAGNYVLVTVTDQGTGIPPDQIPKIFEPFFTTKRQGEGTGLGLSTAYGIVKQSGGFIFVDSAIGTGSCFSLYFPVFDRPIEPVAKRAVTSVPNMGTPQEGVVLLVEDEAPVRAFASRALRMRGYTVLEAENAEEALRTLEDKNLTVDLFVTDVIMPGLDGPSWVKKALMDRPGVKVVFVSGYAEESFADAQISIPNSVFLPKPFSLKDLTLTVQNQLQ
ncbi:ATP-binding protein [Pseudogemmobacter sp. W21_MBD1_M6]|uniref:hybrid sensor histidine kinase/response regulator n=1 Tax=Pseudogemmobacter sp. W21_MBD1_M6 TaxID=3240271 RepID=UPI003F97C4AA